MEHDYTRHDALSNITNGGFLCCPNCKNYRGIKILGMRSHAKLHPAITSEDHVLDYSIVLYCLNCNTEFGSNFTQKQFMGDCWVSVYSFINKIKYAKLKEENNFKHKRKAVPARIRYEILKKQNHQCQSCGATIKDGVKLEVDHIIPVSRGGTNDPNNLQVLCKTCNIGKSNKY
jgi:5-methylcytosine-specific restriction endonuclease McrA